jgi:hypothetical protein
VVSLGEAGCIVGRLGVQPSRRRQVAVALVEVRRHRAVAGHGVSPARRTSGGVVRRTNSLYRSTICTQSASSAVGASAWSWVDDFVKIVGHRETSRFVRTRRDLTRAVAHMADLAEPARAPLSAPHTKASLRLRDLKPPGLSLRTFLPPDFARSIDVIHGMSSMLSIDTSTLVRYTAQPASYHIANPDSL